MQKISNQAQVAARDASSKDLESKSARVDLAVRFYEELTNEVESFVVLAELYGARTLADIVYLQAAILKGTCIENASKESFIADVVRALPSAKVWLKYITNADA